MKVEQIIDELIELAQKMGITVRRDNGAFRGGIALVNDKNILVLNKSMPKDTQVIVIAKAISNLELNNIFVKPVIRDILEKESGIIKQEEDFVLKIQF